MQNKDQALNWTMTKKSVQTKHTFLPLAWERAEQSKGMNVPFAGNMFLNKSLNDFNTKLDSAIEVGYVQVGLGNTKQAEKIGLDVLKVDPHNVRAKILVGAAIKRKEMVLAQAEDNGGSLIDKAKKEIGNGLIDAEMQRRKVITEMVTSQVTAIIKSARGISFQEPDTALEEIKQAKEVVLSSTDMEVQARQQLLKRLERTRLVITSQKEWNEQRIIRDQQRLAQIQAQRALLDKMQLDEQELEQLIDQVRSLMVEGNLGRDVAFDEAKGSCKYCHRKEPKSWCFDGCFL